MSIEKRAESIMLCLNNVCNTGYTLQDCDYDFIGKQIDEIKKEASDVGTSKWIECKDQPVCLCKKCRGWGFISFKFCPHCGRTMENME